MSKISDLTGKQFGELKVLYLCNYRNKYKRAIWHCQCSCGKEIEVCSNSLIRKNTKSCGCLKLKKIKNLNLKHNESKTKLFYIWIAIKQRCLNYKNGSYKNYGGRGISICKEWTNDFCKFKDWAIKNGYKEGLTIDRIDNNGNYEPNNCRWADKNIQNSNTRRTHFIEYNNKKYTMKQLSKLLQINYNTFANRILTYGWSIEEAIKGKRLKNGNISR